MIKFLAGCFLGIGLAISFTSIFAKVSTGLDFNLTPNSFSPIYSSSTIYRSLDVRDYDSIMYRLNSLFLICSR